MRAELESRCLKNEEYDEKAGVSKRQSRELTADERASEEIALHSPIAAERIEDDSGCVADQRSGLDAVFAVGQCNEKNEAAKCEDEEVNSKQNEAGPGK